MLTYERNTNYWDEVFKKNNGGKITTKSIGHDDVDIGLDWLCQGSISILDFGCGNGVWLYKCLVRGTKEHIGIDISQEGIRVAKEIYKAMGNGKFTFNVGGVEALKSVTDKSVDGIVLSNIIDNLMPADTIKVLDEIKRILKPQGKILVKLNPFLTEKQIEDWNIRVIEGNFLDDGLFLWNQTTEEWERLFSNYFNIKSYKDIYYPEHEQYNRLFLLCNDKNSKVLEPRHKEITPEIIRSVNSGADILKQPQQLFQQEINKLDDAVELNGGKVSRVYKGSIEGVERVIKISSGLYRIAELKREAEVLKIIAELGGQHLVPILIDYKCSEKYAYLTMEYIEGMTVREKLSQCKDKKQRWEIWMGVGRALSDIHSLYQQDDLKNSWLDCQLEIAEINMEKKLLDPEEFEHETSEEMLKWLKANKPQRNQLSLVHGDFRTKNILIGSGMKYKVIDWGFVDLGDPYYDLAITDYYFKDSEDRDSFYKGYSANKYNKDLIEYYDKLSKFINV